jgi:hypothetical protein
MFGVGGNRETTGQGNVPMGASPHEDPLDIATGLQELSRFLDSAGFPHAGTLVRLAARSATAQIAQVRAKAARRRKRKPALARQRQSANVVSLGAYRMGRT